VTSALPSIAYWASPIGGGVTESVASFLARRPGGKSLAEKRVETAEFVEGFHAADLSTIGIRSITPEPGESATAQATNVSRPVQGYDTIVEAWVRELGRAIRLRTTVHEVSWQRRRVELVTRSRGRIVRLQARAAVITAPIGVLQRTAHERGGIRFHPDPSRIRSAIEHLAMGSVTKLAVEFDGFPWADLVRGRKHEALERLSFLQVPGGVFNVWWTMAPMRCPLAIAWSGGPPALALAQRKHTEIVTIAVRELAHALGVPTRRIASRVRRTWLHDWQNDPFARGAYSYARVGGADAGEALARPVEGTLFFAGEATDAASGTVEGAIASGRRAARQVARAL
jgi:monoamine oxidase